MNVIEIFAKFVVDTSALDKAVSGVSGLSNSVGNGLASAAKIGAAAISATSAAVMAVGAASVSAGADFDKSMSQVAATMGLTTDQMQNQVSEVDLAWGHFSGNLREYAQEMGKNTAFSATEAADALNYMALAGYSVQQSMEMLPNVLNLAAAGTMDLALASDMITDTQTAFGITAERTTQMVDEMAKAASTGNTSVSQLGNAFLTVGALAKELNGGMVTLEDGTTATVDGVQELEIAFTAMANAGIKGSEAGTHMRNMIMKLSGPTEDGAKALEAMGVSVFDTEGKMRSLGSIFQELNAAMADMKQSEKINIIQSLFNARDLASAEALLGAVEGTVVKIGEETYSMGTAYEKFGDAIYDSTQGFEIVQSSWDKIGDSILDAAGAAQQMADTQLDNLAGDVTLFQSALEGAKIAISDELTPSLRDFVKFGTDGISRLTNAFKDGGLDGAVEEFGNIVSNGVALIIQKAPEITRAGAKLLVALIKGFTQNRREVTKAVKEIFRSITSTFSAEFPRFASIFDGFQKIFENVINIIDGLFDFIENNGPLVSSVIKGVLNGFLAYEAVTGIMNAIQTAIGGVRTVMALLNGEMAITSLVNPYTAIAASIGIVIGLVTTLTAMEQAENEAYLLSLTTLSEENQKRLDSANEYIGKLGEMYDKNMDIVHSVEEQYEPEQKLLDELNGIVDANGRVKEGYEERAEVIVNQLSEAFGIEIDMQDGVIEKYDEVMAKIDEVINKKKAEALISANQDAYTQALKDQVDQYNAMISAQNEYADLQSRRESAVRAAEEAERNMNAAMENGSPSAHAYGQTLQEMTAAIYECDLKMQTLEDTVTGTQEAYYKTQDFITDYNALIDASAGKTEDLGKAISDMTNGVVQRAPERILRKQAEESIKYLDSLIQSHKNGVQVSERQIEEATQKAQEAIDALKSAGEDGVTGYSNAFEDTSDLITNAEALVDAGLKAVAEAQDSNSPSKEYEKLGKDALDGYMLGIQGVKPDLLSELGDIVRDSTDMFSGLIDNAWDWGADMINTFASGISQTMPKLTSKVSDVAKSIKSYIHFSTPDEGPLADFDSYAPDMMKLFAEGITSNAGLVTDAVQDAFNFGDTVMGGMPNVSGMGGAGLITPTVGRDLTVVLQVNEEQLGKVVYRLNNDEVQRVGVDLGKAVIA